MARNEREVRGKIEAPLPSRNRYWVIPRLDACAIALLTEAQSWISGCIMSSAMRAATVKTRSLTNMESKMGRSGDANWWGSFRPECQLLILSQTGRYEIRTVRVWRSLSGPVFSKNKSMPKTIE